MQILCLSIDHAIKNGGVFFGLPLFFQAMGLKMQAQVYLKVVAG
jgi:hypothetical protein